jgi:ketosteroid isomerase-like protein
VFGGFQASGEEWTQEQKQIWKSVEAIWENYKEGDLEAIMAVLHDDALEWWEMHAMPLDKNLIKHNYQGWLNYNELVSYELEPLAIHIYGAVANVFYRSKWKGNKLSGSARAMSTWIKQENKWKRVGSMSSTCGKLPLCMK